MNQAPAENTLTRVKDEIRADAELVRRRTGELRVVVVSRPPVQRQEPLALRKSYSIAELCQSNYTTFLKQAYETLLRRAPDPAGFDHQLRLLATGRSKIEILGNLRWSSEGRDIGVHVPELLPRYLLAKVMSIPVLGYPIEWFVSLCSLPRMVRHQRATDVHHSARNLELGEQCKDMARQIEEVNVELGRLRSEKSAEKLVKLESRVGQLNIELDRLGSESMELRHVALSVNHWFASLRKNLSELERAEAEQEREFDAFHADVAKRVLESDSHRPARLQLWSSRLASHLPKAAEVLDFCSGEDWLECLLARGLDAAGVDTNEEIGERARKQGRVIIAVEPMSVLSRAADHSLHGLTALDAGFLLRRIPTAKLLDEARRVLRANGWMLLGFHNEPTSIADRLAGRPESAIDGELMVKAFQVAGYADVELMRSVDGAVCVLGRAVTSP